MHSILAIAKVTLKDALRKKVLFTILFFAVLLTVVSGFLPVVQPEDRVRQLAKISLAGIGFFGMVVAIFLSAPSLPDDISKKTIFTVLTKPARRWQIIAGKVLGLGYVLALILAIMGFVAYVCITVWATRVSGDIAARNAKVAAEAPAEGADAPQAPSQMPLLQGNKAIWARSMEYHGVTLDVTKPMVESKRAIASGFDRITFHFEGLGGERYLGDNVYAQVTLFCHGVSIDPVTREGTAAMHVTNPTTGETKQVVFGADMLRPVYLGFPKQMIDKQGRVEITISRHIAGGSYSAMASSVAVLSQPASFTLNFAKALVLMFLQYMVLVFIAVSASTILTSTVSTIFALFVYFTGSLTEVLRGQALTLGAGANIFTMGQHDDSGHAGEAAMTGIQWLVNMVLRYFYLGVSIVFPNLSFYDPSERISLNQYISLGDVWQALWYAAVYAGIAFFIAWVIFRRKEVA